MRVPCASCAPGIACSRRPRFGAPCQRRQKHAGFAARGRPRHWALRNARRRHCQAASRSCARSLPAPRGVSALRRQGPLVPDARRFAARARRLDAHTVRVTRSPGDCVVSLVRGALPGSRQMEVRRYVRAAPAARRFAAPGPAERPALWSERRHNLATVGWGALIGGVAGFAGIGGDTCVFCAPRTSRISPPRVAVSALRRHPPAAPEAHRFAAHAPPRVPTRVPLPPMWDG